MAAPVPRLSVDDYLRIDRDAELKSEYHNGDMVPIAAVSWEHGLISASVAREIGNRILGGPCSIVSHPMRVQVTRTRFVYPDIVVVCGRPELTDEHIDTITNPKVIVEVLSPSTADYDYGGKFAFYRQLSSFEEYLLISQNMPRVEVYRKTLQGWDLRTYEGLDACVPVQSLQIEVPLDSIYQGVEFRPVEAGV